MDEGRLDGEKKNNEVESKPGWEREDVWRVLCVAESIHPCLLVLLLFLPLALGVDKTPNAYAGKAQHQLPRTPSDFPSSIPQLSSSIPLSYFSQMSLTPFSPCSPPSMLFSLNSSVSLVFHIAVIPASSPSFPSSLMLCCLHSLALLSLTFFSLSPLLLSMI